MIGSSAWGQKADVTQMTDNGSSSLLDQMNHVMPSGDEHPAAHAAYCEGTHTLITDLPCEGSCAGSCSEGRKVAALSAAQLRWRRVRCRIKVAKIIETLLHDVRGQQIEQLYSLDWSEPPSASKLWERHVFNSASCQRMEQLCHEDGAQYLKPKPAIQAAQGKVDNQELMIELESSATRQLGLDYENEWWDCKPAEEACRSFDACKHATTKSGTGFSLLDYPLALIESYLACCVIRDDA